MSLWSFEGVRGCARHALSQVSVVIAAGKHLFPFRTEKLSPPAPMVLGGQPPGRVGRRRIIFARGRDAMSASRFVPGRLTAGAQLLAPVRDRARAAGGRARRPADASRTCAASPSSRERVDGVERLGRRARPERRRAPSACSRRTSASASPCGEPQSARRAAVGVELALRREQQVRRTPLRSGRARRAAPVERKPPMRLASTSAAGERAPPASGRGRRGA